LVSAQSGSALVQDGGTVLINGLAMEPTVLVQNGFCRSNPVAVALRLRGVNQCLGSTHGRTGKRSLDLFEA
jgi:hypothetical protein